MKYIVTWKVTIQDVFPWLINPSIHMNNILSIGNKFKLDTSNMKNIVLFFVGGIWNETHLVVLNYVSIDNTTLLCLTIRYVQTAGVNDLRYLDIVSNYTVRYTGYVYLTYPVAVGMVIVIAETL